jgi:hypothetical protein
VSVRTLAQRAREEKPLLAAAELMRRAGVAIPSVVDGNSMGASLPAGSDIAIDLDDRRYEAGAVMAVLSGSTVVAHRVIGRGRGHRARGYWLTCGDAVLVPDPPVAADRVIGRVRLKSGAPIPSRPRRRWISRVAVAAIAVALEIDVRLARLLTRALVTLLGQSSGTP